ncbi:hypothetical protein C8P66_10743 [Humitalea rosea]|uniref:DUF3299 domain-containing protein n=1 Tax=Humitalea rosea TaxID=990373 RepID=A0A2W7J6U3_9PROT|nr:hypothetical protein [Humitalea rosea]PZW47006.1 hypothetical protein C8P66_10743 [Humitalea rosea]
MAARRHTTTRRPVLAAAAAFLLPPNPVAAAERLAFDDLYSGWSVMGASFSPRLLALVGQEAALRGYMAPPLKAEADFFVLAREPMALCPFCSSDADWPVDIVVVYLRRQAQPTDPGTRIEVVGRVETGSWTDPDSGFVSQIRLRDARFRPL